MVHFNITQIFLQHMKSEIEYNNEKQVALKQNLNYIVITVQYAKRNRERETEKKRERERSIWVKMKAMTKEMWDTMLLEYRSEYMRSLLDFLRKVFIINSSRIILKNIP